jgi:hypothetical protein
MMHAGYLTVTARLYESDCCSQGDCEGSFDHQTLTGHSCVVKTKTNLRKYQRWALLNRVVNVSEAELGFEKGGWWFAVHFEQTFDVG